MPVAVRENLWEPLKLGLISGYKNSWRISPPGALVSSININCVSYSSANGISLRLSEAEWKFIRDRYKPFLFSTLKAYATSFCVPGSWILSVPINGEIAGRLRCGCKHKSNRGQPSSEDPHTVSMNSKSFYFTKVFIKAFGAYVVDIGSRKLT